MTTTAAAQSIIQRIYAGASEPAPLPTPPHPTHQFGPEGRCWNCDCRIYGKWSPLPCDG